MVNDNQINYDPRILTHNATTLFIKDDVKGIEPPELYDLDREFANTKKNKNKTTVILLTIFTFVFFATAYAVTHYIETQNSKIPISINAFEDVNLREIFDKAKQYEKEMRNAVRDLDDLYIKRDVDIGVINQNALNSISIIEANNPLNKKIQIEKIEFELKETLLKEEVIWKSELLLVQKKISTIQDKIDSYDTRIIEKAKEQESIINNQQERFDMELEKSITYYEDKIKNIHKDNMNQLDSIILTNKGIITTIKKKNQEALKDLEKKYNPTFSEDFIYLKENESTPPIYNFTSKNINKLMFDEGLLDNQNIEAQLVQMENVQSTFLRLNEIPYYNSPKSAIEFIEQEYYDSIINYSNLINDITPILQNKNSKIQKQTVEIEQLDYFLSNYVKTNRLNGVIIDPRTKDIKLFIDPIYKVQNGTIGFVFRNDSDFIGTITLNTKNGVLVGKVLELVDTKRRISPFDMILINLN